ncbi:hypothetical protein EGJ09_18445 [Pseudomonas sp. p106]|nr:hypothetical protein EGJ09_18445 [Pseudomonas sp. p106]
MKADTCTVSAVLSSRLQALCVCPQLRAIAAVRGRTSGLPGSKFPVRRSAYSSVPNGVVR